MPIKQENIADKLLAKLLATRPVVVKAYSNDEDFREIPVPERRRKWKAIVAIVEARPWVRVEMLDKRGGILGYLDNDDVDEVEVLPAAITKEAEANPAFSLALAVNELMLRSQNAALEARDKEHARSSRGKRRS